MAEPVIARKNFYEVEIEPGMEYLWCVCGRSADQPFCDGLHTGTGIAPKPFKAKEAMRFYL